VPVVGGVTAGRPRSAWSAGAGRPLRTVTRAREWCPKAPAHLVSAHAASLEALCLRRGSKVSPGKLVVSCASCRARWRATRTRGDHTCAAVQFVYKWCFSAAWPKLRDSLVVRRDALCVNDQLTPTTAARWPTWRASTRCWRSGRRCWSSCRAPPIRECQPPDGATMCGADGREPLYTNRQPYLVLPRPLSLQRRGGGAGGGVSLLAQHTGAPGRRQQRRRGWRRRVHRPRRPPPRRRLRGGADGRVGRGRPAAGGRGGRQRSRRYSRRCRRRAVRRS
jgi:hypothetical protein